MNSGVLFISPEAPYPLAGGGAQRTASLLNFLARHYEIDLIVFREPGAEDPRVHLPHGLVRRIHVLELPPNARHTMARVARNAGRLVRGVPPLMDRFAGFGESITALTKGRHYELAIIEHFWCAPYQEQAATVADATLLDLHNVESVLHERCARVERGAQTLAHGAFRRICRAWEQKWLPRFTHLLAASDDDARFLRGISPGSQVAVYPNAIPYLPARGRHEEDVVVFSGNLEYHPNVSAVRYFRNEIWPGLRERWPGLIWRLVGKNPEAVEAITGSDPQIEFSGAVDDAIQELSRAKVAIVPVLAGSGTRIKILESWAAGVPVVSTALGAEGLGAKDGEHLLVADGACAFRDAVSKLLADPGLRTRVGQGGRYLYECEFTWEAAWKRLHFLEPCYHEEI